MATITIRVSPAERAEIEARARLAGHTLSDYIRDAIRTREFDKYGNALDRLTDVELRLAKLEAFANLD